MALRIWVFAVAGDIDNRRPMSSFVNPRPARRMMSTSRAVRAAAAGRAGAASPAPGGGVSIARAAREWGLATLDGVDGFKERVRGRAFADESVGARRHRRAHDVCVLERREDEDARPVKGRDAADSLRRIGAGQPRHPHVHEDDVGVQSLGHVERLDPVPGLPHDLDAGLLKKERPERFSDEALIIGEQDAQAPLHGRSDGSRAVRV